MRNLLAAICAASLALVPNLDLSHSRLVQDPAAGKQVEQSLATTDGGAIPYLLYQPENYTQDGKKVPLMLFLHGRGESNGPLSIVAKWGPPQRLAAGEHMKYLVVSPQCPRESFWSNDDQQTRLLELLKHIKQTYNIDEDRIYLTGLSMGGFGTWRLAAEHTDMFAAAVPVCGKGDPKQGAALTQLPIWAWHGTEDNAVPYQCSVAMVDAIKAAGGTKVRFTSLEHIGHNSWQAAYQSDDLYRWLDKQRASKNQAK
jgi:predicted peptidase